MGKSRPAPMEFVGIDNIYAESATPDQLMEKYGLTAPYIVKAVKGRAEEKEPKRLSAGKFQNDWQRIFAARLVPN